MAKAFGPKIARSDFCMKVDFDKVCDDRGVMTVPRSNKKDTVVMSEGCYNNLMAQLHITGDKTNDDRLTASTSGTAAATQCPFYAFICPPCRG